MKRNKTPSETRGTLQYFKTRTWAGIMKRTVNGKYPDWKNRCHASYLEKGTRCFIKREDFYDWCDVNKEVILGLYKEGKTPSIDRLDPDGHYSFDNIQIIDWQENFKKRRVKKKPVECEDMITGEKRIFESAAKASRTLDIDFRSISDVCRKRRKSCKGLEWRFIEEKSTRAI